ncbi:hypothetical protein BD626DRAFT_478173 [Schizophyllum amplum]|uniref:Secreted protein n=1 Tax=Schizophyllum amplum TaxID=97359 RepID=A0A550D0T3_9AGAR|nr:hypothetical protein BD626DRAFT_478173 [Auriculariopsis ampla]
MNPELMISWVAHALMHATLAIPTLVKSLAPRLESRPSVIARDESSAVHTRKPAVHTRRTWTTTPDEALLYPLMASLWPRPRGLGGARPT